VADLEKREVRIVFSNILDDPLTPGPLSPKGARGEISSGLVAALLRRATHCETRPADLEKREVCAM
jgi:hypothetical protein